MDFFNESNRCFSEGSLIAPEYEWEDEKEYTDDVVAMVFRFRDVDLLVDFNEKTGEIVSIHLPEPEVELYDILPDDCIRRIENAIKSKN
jgi:hypothetical protein